MIDIDALESLAKNATPGPWEAATRLRPSGYGPLTPQPSGHQDDRCIRVANSDKTWPDDIVLEPSEWLNCTSEDMALMAAANPQTILALIAELREAREEAEGVVEDYQDLGRLWHEERTKVDEALGLAAPFSIEKTLEAIDRLMRELRAAREVIQVHREDYQEGWADREAQALANYDRIAGTAGSDRREGET